MIVLVTNSGYRIEFPNVYNTDIECLVAAKEMQSGHAGTRAACVANTVPLSDERAKQFTSEEWWRRRPVDIEATKKRKP
jgi:hypothetical protein